MYDEVAPIIIAPSSVIPSTRFMESCYPSSLSWHLLSAASTPCESRPSEQTPDSNFIAEGTMKANGLAESNNSDTQMGPTKGNGIPNTFLGMPAMNLNMNVDMRKWNWPGYLTFGKGSGKRPTELPTDDEQRKVQISKDQPTTEREHAFHIHIDRNALEDAISSDRTMPVDPGYEPFDRMGQQDPLSQSERTIVPSDRDVSDCGADEAVCAADKMQEPEAPMLPSANLMLVPAKGDTASLTSSEQFEAQCPVPPQWSSTTVHLADSYDSLTTRPRRIFYLAASHHFFSPGHHLC
jgi:hypothetical protein